MIKVFGGLDWVLLCWETTRSTVKKAFNLETKWPRLPKKLCTHRQRRVINYDLKHITSIIHSSTPKACAQEGVGE